MPLISVIVPIYNVEKYLQNCINSILEQTFKDFELILVNDGSPDQCGEICNYYAQKDKRIKVIHKINEGVSSARNTGINAASGEYLAFVDPDDTIEPQMYEVLLNSALTHGTDIVVCPIKTINLISQDTYISSVWREIGVKVEKEVIENKIIPSIICEKTYSLVSSVNKLYRKAIFDESGVRFDEQKHHSEDARLNFVLLTLVENIVFINQPLYNYYVRKRDSLTQVFRDNLYEYALDNKKFMIQLCKKYNLDKHISTIKNHYTTVTLGFMQDVVFADLLIHNKYSIISNILNNDEFIEDILKYNGPTAYCKFLKYVCFTKNEKLFFYLIRFKKNLQILLKR
ncbi:glycosyltransferase [Priestia megaterium]|uniref:glycosyltransferase n=1 Tax=Priestia megaterium TaxID=1404 RepID=UPI0021ACA3DB|nr:glycosyltransferase [Priestia megaterium]MCR8925004.1 glycosyltransferase [Priestia megaterium]